MDDDSFPSDASDAGDGSALPPPPVDVPVGAAWSLDTASEPTGPAPRRRAPAALALGLVIALLLVGGATAAFLAMRGADEELLGMMPADSQVVVVGYLDPSAGQKANLFRMASRFPDLQAPGRTLENLRSFLDENLEPIGMDASVLDWIGVEAGMSVQVTSIDTQPDIAFLIDTDDEEAAAADLADGRAATSDLGWVSSEYGGVEIWAQGSNPSAEYAATAIVHGVVVVTNSEGAMHGVIDTAVGNAESIESSSAFTESTAALPEGRLGLLYVDVASLADELRSGLESGGVPVTTGGLEDLDAVRAVAGSLSAEPDGMALDVSASYDPAKLSEETRAQVAAPDAPNRLVQMVPADALAVYGLKHLDLAVDSFMTQLEQTDPRAIQEMTKAGFAGDGGLLSHLTGDLAFEATPKASGAGVGGALIVGVDDADAARRAIESLTTMAFGSVQATAQGMASSGPLASPDEWKPTWKAADYRGIEIRTLTLPYDGGSGISYAIFDGAAVIGASTDDVRHVIDTAQDGPAFDPAASLPAVPTSDGFLYVDPGGIGEAIRAALPPEGQATYDKEVKPKLDPVQAVEFGAESDETHTHIRFFVSIP